MAFTPFVESDLPSMANFNEKFQEVIEETEDKVGDIKTTVRTDLGDDWLLCNGDSVDAEEYPELDSLLPKELNNVGYVDEVVTSDTTQERKLVQIVNNHIVQLIGTDPASGSSGYDWYIYSRPVGGNTWAKSATALIENSGTSFDGQWFISYANGIYYFYKGYESVGNGTTSKTYTVKASEDLVTWTDSSITINFSGGLYTAMNMAPRNIAYNENTGKYLVAFQADYSGGNSYYNVWLTVGEKNGEDLIVTTTNMQSGIVSANVSYQYSDMWLGVSIVGNFFVLPLFASNSSPIIVCIDSSATSNVQFPIVLGNTSSDSTSGKMIVWESQGNAVIVTAACTYYVDLVSKTVLSKNTNLRISFPLYSALWHDIESKSIYWIGNSVGTINKYTYDNPLTDSGWVSAESKSVDISSNSTSMTNGTVLVGPGFFSFFYSLSPYTRRNFTPWEVAILPTITTEGAYNYIKGR